MHQLAGPGAAEDDRGRLHVRRRGRLSYLRPLGERPAGVGWVASTGRASWPAGHASWGLVAAAGAAAGVGCALLLALAVHGEVEAVVILVRSALTRPYDVHAIEHATTLADQAATALALVRARAEAGTDPVTGCMNHRACAGACSEEIGRAMRTDGKLSCMLIDLDNFKLVNDRHGHSAGDAVLRDVAQALVGEFRAFDRVARYGGDEFVVILPDADLESAAAAAARALRAPAGPALLRVDPRVAASIGVAQWCAPMSTELLLDACDAALLQLKREGKGRVTRAVSRPRADSRPLVISYRERFCAVILRTDPSGAFGCE